MLCIKENNGNILKSIFFQILSRQIRILNANVSSYKLPMEVYMIRIKIALSIKNATICLPELYHQSIYYIALKRECNPFTIKFERVYRVFVCVIIVTLPGDLSTRSTGTDLWT